MFGLGLGTPPIGTSSFGQYAAGTPGQAGMFPGFPGYAQYGFGSPGLGYTGIDTPGFTSPGIGSWPDQQQYGQQYGFGAARLGVPNYFGLGSGQLGMPHHYGLGQPGLGQWGPQQFGMPNYYGPYGLGQPGPGQWGPQQFGMPNDYYGPGRSDLSNQFGFGTRDFGQWRPWAPFGQVNPNHHELSQLWASRFPYGQVVRALVPTPIGLVMLDVVR